jgi:hypothetical protein
MFENPTKVFAAAEGAVLAAADAAEDAAAVGAVLGVAADEHAATISARESVTSVPATDLGRFRPRGLGVIGASSSLTVDDA